MLLAFAQVQVNKDFKVLLKQLGKSVVNSDDNDDDNNNDNDDNDDNIYDYDYSDYDY